MASTRLYSEALETFQRDILARRRDSDTVILNAFLLDGSKSSFATPASAKKAALQLATDAENKYSGIKIGKIEVVPKKWVDNILGNIDNIVAVGGFLTKNAPESVGMAWFAISLTLGAIRNNYNLYALFGQGLTDITEVMVIVMHYDNLYDERDKPGFKASDLVNKLFRDTVAAYVAVLDFAFSVKKHMSGGSFDKVKHAFKDFFNTQAPKFQGKLSHIADLKGKILESSQGAFQDKTMQQFGMVDEGLKQIRQNQSQGIELQIEQRQMLAAIRDDFQNMKDLIKRKTPWEELRDEFVANKKRLSPLSGSQSIINRLLAKKHENTCTWVFENENYRTWAESNKNAFLCIAGGPGSGKSTVLGSIARKLGTDTNVEAVFVNYVSCVGDDDSQSTSLKGQKLSRIHNTLLYQIYELAAQDEGTMSLLESCNRIFRDPKKEKFNLGAAVSMQTNTPPDFVETMIRLVTTLQRNTTLIVDAVGTLTDEKQAELHKNLCKLVDSSSGPYRISILVGGLSNSRFIQLASSSNLCIDLSQNNNNHNDMDIVLDSYLRNLPGWSEREKKQAKEMVLIKAGSNFSYLEDVAMPFLQQPFQRPVATYLAKLPESMNESFDQALLAMAPNYFELLRLAVTWCLLSPRTVTVKEIVELYSGVYTTDECGEEADIAIDDSSYDSNATELEIHQISAASGPFLAIERTNDGRTLVKLQDARQVKNFCINEAKAQVIPHKDSSHVCDICKSAMKSKTTLNIEPKIAHYEIVLASLKHINSPLFQKRFGLLEDLTTENSTVDSAEHEEAAVAETSPEQDPAVENGKEEEASGNDNTDQTIEESLPNEPANTKTHEGGDADDYSEGSVDNDDGNDNSNAGSSQIEDYWNATLYTRDSKLRCELIDWPYHLKEAERLWPIKERQNDPVWVNYNQLIQQELRRFVSNPLVFKNWQKLWEVHLICGDPVLKSPICLAASLGLATWVESLLDAGADINEISGYRNVAQASGELAYNHQNVELLRLLLRKGADFSRAGKDDAPGLHIWLDLFGWTRSVVEAFVDHDIDFDIRNQYGWTGLHMFGWRSDDVEAFHRIMNGLSKRPDINAADNWGETPIFKLLWRREIPKGLLKAYMAVEGIKINYEANNSQQPLALASQWGSLDIVELLIAEKADLHDGDNYWRTALHKAAETGQVESIKALLAAGSVLDQVDKGGYTPLQYAAWKGQLSAVQCLVAKGSAINCIDNDEHDPLFNAIIGSGDNQATAMFLLTELRKAKYPASEVNRLTKGGRSSLRQAASQGYADVLQGLLEYISESDDADCKAMVNKGDAKWQRTPLHCAAIRGHSECVRLLISYGADPKLRDGEKKTPLVAAQETWAERNEKGYEDVLLHLIDADPEAALADAELPAIAAANGSVQVLRKLHVLQADLNRYDGLGWTPLAHARYSGHKAAEHFLKHELSWGGTLPSSWVDPAAVATIGNNGLQVKKEAGDHVCIVSDKPLPFGVERFYYEIAIDKSDGDQILAIGFCTLGVSPHKFPGWLPKGKASFALSWAYHGDDGCLYHKSPSLAAIDTGEPYGTGDTIGCGVDLESRKIWFTKNGRKISNTFDDVKGRLFPILGLRSPVSIRTNFGREPFLWKDE